MKESKLYLPLAVSTVAAVGLTLARYVVLTDRSPLARIDFAVFFAVLAAGLTWAAFKLFGWWPGWARVVLAYATVFSVVRAVWALLHG